MEIFQLLTSSAWSVLMIALFFGGSIFIHELGHFWMAKKRGVKVDRFSIGFGPAIFKWTGKDGVEYRLSWLPLGGYVALPQLADMRGLEGEPKSDVEALPSPNYTTRMLVFGAGAFMNVVLAFVLTTILWKVGIPTYPEMMEAKIGHVLPTLRLPDGSTPQSPAAAAGLRPGDVIVSIDGVKVRRWDDMRQTLFTGSGRGADGRPQARLEVRRGDATIEVVARPVLAGIEEMRMLGVAPYEELTVGAIKPGSLAEKAGLLAGDRLLEIDGAAVTSSQVYVDGLKNNPAATATLVVERAGRRETILVPDRSGLETSFDLGLKFADNRILIFPTPWEQIRDKVVSTARTLYSLINRNSDVKVGNLTGPIGIARVFHIASQIDIRHVISFAALMNISLAIFNLMPLPVLDGGHMVLATLTRLRGKQVSPSILNPIQMAFVTLLLTLMLYIGYRDVRRIIHDDGDGAATEPNRSPDKPATPPEMPPAVVPVK